MASPRRFTVGGPFEVPIRGRARSRYLDMELCEKLWSGAAAGWGAERGCYVFALRRGPGFLPLYVGKTARQSFKAECFGERNYRLLHEAMYGRNGILVLFLLEYERGRGRFNTKVIGDLEKFLVELALDRNPELKNKVYARKTSGFMIPGVHRAGAGAPTKPAAVLKRVLGL